ncbi:hypothetical protein J6590_058959 [Homalodisca vitripennis]|nr:hypothetical protein J6590_058957 [Homalodisca vitripennis]KAG8296359.1 hypothetical protein J6590_058959 [Homalodisca vitripennis]
MPGATTDSPLLQTLRFKKRGAIQTLSPGQERSMHSVPPQFSKQQVTPYRVERLSVSKKNDKDWTVQKRLLSARRASQMALFDNEIERWGEVDVPYLPSQLIGNEAVAMATSWSSIHYSATPSHGARFGR